MLNRFWRGLVLGVAVVALNAPLTVAQTPSAAEQELVKLENQWAEAVVKGDVLTLDRLFADDYLSIDGTGATFTKTQDIANVKSGNFKLSAHKLDELKVRVHGEIAVVTGRNTVTATYMGKDVSGAYRFTDVFVKRAGRWQVLTTQATLVTGK